MQPCTSIIINRALAFTNHYFYCPLRNANLDKHHAGREKALGSTRPNKPEHCWSDLVIFDVDSVKQQVIGPIFILLIRFK